MRSVLVAACIVVATLVAFACAGSEPERGSPPTASDPDPAFAKRKSDPQPRDLPPRLRCPDDGSNCASVRGRILYVEAVDPDGDGDAHFALSSEEGITLPGITVVDVSVDLRPEPLPGPGDYLSAVGPVYPGSYGQAQIEATAIRVARQR